MSDRDAKLKRAQSMIGTSDGRPDHDYYPTPPWCTHALLKHVGPLTGTCWEPGCGDGRMSEVLVNHGLDVYSSDLVYRGYGDPEPFDFVHGEIGDITFDHVITNPPYSLAYEFVDRALSVATVSVCMLMKLAFLETSRRWEKLRGRYPTDVYVFTTRPHFTRNGVPMKNGGMIPFAWFVWRAPFRRDVDETTVRHIFGGPETYGEE